MDATNRVEAVRCFQFAKKCLDDGDRVKCVRLLEKSRHLCPTEECQSEALEVIQTISFILHPRCAIQSS